MENSNPTPKAGAFRVFTVIFGIIAAGLTALESMVSMGDRLEASMLIPMTVGSVIGAVIVLPLLFAGVARVTSKEFTARRGWKAAMIAMVLVSLVQVKELAVVGAEKAKEAKNGSQVAAVEPTWQRFDSLDWGFSAEFPGVPKTSVTEELATTALLAGKNAYIVTITTLEPGADPLTAYELVEQSLAETFESAESFESRPVVREDVIGRAIWIAGLQDKQDFSAQLFIKDDLLYMASINGEAPLDEAHAARFLSSFSFVAGDTVALNEP